MRKFWLILLFIFFLLSMSKLSAQEQSNERYKIYNCNSKTLLLDSWTGETWQLSHNTDLHETCWTRIQYYHDALLSRIIALTPKSINEASKNMKTLSIEKSLILDNLTDEGYKKALKITDEEFEYIKKNR